MAQTQSQVVHARLTYDEYNQLCETASANGVAKSRMLRRLIRESTGCGPDFFQTELRSINNAVMQLRSIGLNLNQIARKINAGEHSSDIDPNDLAELSDHVERVANEVGKLSKRTRTRWTPTKRK